MKPVPSTLLRILAAWTAGLGLIWMPGDVLADNYTKGQWSISKNVLSLQGEILPRSSGRFHRLFASAMLSVPYPNPIQIRLDSPGGDLNSALNIVRIIKSAQREKTDVVITVQSGKRCFSTCLLLFAAGDQRKAATDALFRFPNSASTVKTLRILSGIAEVNPNLANFLLAAKHSSDALPASQLGLEFDSFISVRD